MFRTELLTNIRNFNENDLEKAVAEYTAVIQKTLFKEIETIKNEIKEWASKHEIELNKESENLDEMALALLSQSYDYGDYSNAEENELTIPFDAQPKVFLELIEACDQFIKNNWSSYDA